MPANGFPACLAFTLKEEGGYSSIRSDPGNWTGGKVGVGELKGTKYGIDAGAHPDLDIKALTVDQAGAIYRAEYWNGVRGDDLPAGVALVTFDYGVNSGDSRAAKALQRAVGVPQDGKIGDATLKAVATKAATDVVKAVSDLRLSFLEGLATWRTFGVGWAPRVGRARATGLLMATGSLQVAKDDVQALDKKAAAHAGSAKAAGGAAAPSAGGGAIVAHHAATTDWHVVFFAGGLVLGLILLALYFAWRASAHRAAAKGAESVIAEHEASAAAAPVKGA